MNHFKAFETGSDNEYIIKMINPPASISGGSYHVLQARLLGLTYAEYLRFCNQVANGAVTIRGKNHLYPVAYWKKSEELTLMIKLLNNKMELAIKELARKEKE